MEEIGRKVEVFTEIVLGVFRVNGRLLEMGDEVTRPAGLTGARWQVLEVVKRGPASVAQVAREMSLTRQGVQRTADILAADGIIEYEENPNHRRAKLMRITAKGRKAFDYIEERQAEWANRASEEHDLEDLQATARVLSRLAERMEKEKP